MSFIGSFKHLAGEHCETTALRDVLEYNGIELSEATVFGLDGCLGFFYWEGDFFSGNNENSAFVSVGGRNGWLTKNSLIFRLLGVDVDEKSFASADKAFAEAKQLICAEKPLIIRVDMAYLSYLKMETDFHFGGHLISQVGFDDDNDLVYVYETGDEKAHTLSVENIKKARGAKECGKLAPSNTRFVLSVKPDKKHPAFAAAAKFAIKNVCKNMLASSVKFSGLPALKALSEKIKSWESLKDSDLIQANGSNAIRLLKTMGQMYGSIEKYGTGGAVFRKLYLKFLNELAENPQINTSPGGWNQDDLVNLEKSIDLLNNAVNLWDEFTVMLKSCLEESDNDLECKNKMDFNIMGDLVSSIYNQEQKTFKQLYEIKL